MRRSRRERGPIVAPRNDKRSNYDFVMIIFFSCIYSIESCRELMRAGVQILRLVLDKAVSCCDVLGYVRL